MEDFQSKINEMKQKIDNIKTDIESIRSESANNRNRSYHSNYKTTSLRKSKNTLPIFSDDCDTPAHVTARKEVTSYKSKHRPSFNDKYDSNQNSYKPYINKTQMKTSNYNFNYHLNNQNSSSLFKDFVQVKDQRNRTAFNYTQYQSANPVKYNTANNSFLLKNNTNSNFTKKTRTSRNTSERYSIANDTNYEDLLNEIIDITNEYQNDMNVNSNNIVENYKKQLREAKIRNEFINQVFDLYKAKTGNEVDANTSGGVITVWKWIKGLSSEKENGYKMSRKSREAPSEFGSENPYQRYCEKIMRDYRIRSMGEFQLFIDRLLKKSNKNENFLEGIKKILLTEHKIEDY